jgi:PIN domain nuclease of toxin-antitoxin system
MNLLLDTHIAVWAIRASSLIPSRVRALIGSAENEVYVSVVTIWEIAIKRALRRPGAPPFAADAAIALFAEAGYILLDVKAIHAAAVEKLPLLHGDPFDRLLVSQAMTESMRLVTGDAKLAAYSQTVISW